VPFRVTNCGASRVFPTRAGNVLLETRRPRVIEDPLIAAELKVWPRVMVEEVAPFPPPVSEGAEPPLDREARRAALGRFDEQFLRGMAEVRGLAAQAGAGKGELAKILTKE